MEQNKSQAVEEEQSEKEVEQVDGEQPEENGEQQDEVLEEETPLSEEQMRIQQLEQQVNELNNKLLRTHADYENFRRRTKEEREAAAKYRAQSLIEGLLPALDNFERALMVDPQQDETKSLLQGMEMVYRQMQEVLKSEGLEVINAVGQTFDPHLHQAVMQVNSDEYDANQVVEELQKGYRLKDRVIRPSMVKVNA